MSGFIVLNDGRAWTASNGAFDAVIEVIATTLSKSTDKQVLALWLLDQRSCVKGPGMGNIDFRELTPANQQLLIATVLQVCNLVTLPEPLDSWSDKVHLLARMVESFQRGEPPMILNPDMRDLIPPSGRRSGPGWE